MKFAAILTSLAVFSVPNLVAATTASYDTVYDNRDTSLAAVACSNGKNGLLSRGFTTFGSLPNFPFIGGASAIKGWNSPNCGTCWNITYTAKGKPTTITMLAIDVSSETEFNIAERAMNKLTNGQAVQLGVVNVTSVQVPVSDCGL